jgi:hypothetical protein
MEESPFGRQREPIEILLTGDPRDTEYYAQIIKRVIESRGYDQVERQGNKIKVYPAANND